MHVCFILVEAFLMAMGRWDSIVCLSCRQSVQGTVSISTPCATQIASEAQQWLMPCTLSTISLALQPHAAVAAAQSQRSQWAEDTDTAAAVVAAWAAALGFLRAFLQAKPQVLQAFCPIECAPHLEAAERLSAAKECDLLTSAEQDVHQARSLECNAYLNVPFGQSKSASKIVMIIASLQSVGVCTILQMLGKFWHALHHFTICTTRRL